MRRCQANLPNRCRRQIDRIARRAFDGEQWMDREGRAATTGNTYCGNLLWQSGLTLLAPYLMWKAGDYDLFYLESANVVDMTCDKAKSQPGIWPLYEGFTRHFLYFKWR